MKKRVLPLVGFLIIMLAGIVSAASFLLSDLLDSIAEGTLIILLVFVISFALLFFALNRALKENTPIVAVISFALAFGITYWVNKSDFDLTGWIYDIGISTEVLSLLIPLLSIALVVFLIMKLRKDSLFIFGGFLLASSFFVYEKAIVIGLGIILILVRFFIGKNKHRTRGEARENKEYVRGRRREKARDRIRDRRERDRIQDRKASRREEEERKREEVKGRAESKREQERRRREEERKRRESEKRRRADIRERKEAESRRRKEEQEKKEYEGQRREEEKQRQAEEREERKYVRQREAEEKEERAYARKRQAEEKRREEEERKQKRLMIEDTREERKQKRLRIEEKLKSLIRTYNDLQRHNPDNPRIRDLAEEAKRLRREKKRI